MAEKQKPIPGFDWAFGFVGEGEIHPNNSRANLSDLIAAQRRSTRGAKIKFVIPVEPFTPTLESLADFCVNSGYDLELVGHEESQVDKRVRPFLRMSLKGAKNQVEFVSIGEGVPVAIGVVNQIALPGRQPRLILTGDADVDDWALIAAEHALSKNIVVRSLLHGLDNVVLETEDEEKPPVAPHSRDIDEDLEDETEEIEDEDDELEDEDEPDEEEDDESDEDEEIDIDGDEDEDEDDDEEIEDSDSADEEDESDEEDADEDLDDPEDSDDVDEDDEDDPEDDEPDEDSEDEDEDESDSEDDEESEEDEEEEEMAAPEPPKLTEGRLLRLAQTEKGKQQIMELADKYKVQRGRGIRIPAIVQGVVAAAEKRAARKAGTTTVTKSAPVKAKTTTKARTPEKSVRKVATPVSTKTTTKSAGTKPVSAKLGVSSNTLLNKKLRALIGAIEEVIEAL